MAVKSMNGRATPRLLGIALAIGALALAPAALRAQEQQVQRRAGAQVRGPDERGEWAGIGIEDVTPAKAKELKLPGEYGALVTEVSNDTPAAKAGIKAGDVITEYNGQRVEGTLELRRLIRETPSGRTVKIGLWRDGKEQEVSLEIASGPADSGPLGRAFGFGQAPPDFAPAPGRGPSEAGPSGSEQFGFRRAMATRPALGVSAEDLSGQLGNYFGAPDGEGVLVTDVPADSPGGKSGLKAGDVITQVDGERVRNVGELRDHLRDKQREGKNVKLDVIRKGAPISLNVQLEKPAAPPTPSHQREIPL